MNIKNIVPTEEEQQEYLAYKCYEDVLKNYEDGLKSLSKVSDDLRKEKHILICGGMAAFDKGLLDFLNQWNKCQPELFLLSEVTAQYRRYTKEVLQFPFICTPHLLAKEMIILGMEIPITSFMSEAIASKTYLREAVENLEARHKTLGKGYAIAWAFYASQYINGLLDKLQPQKVILWNAFYAFHHIFVGICRERHIPVGFMEFGCLPGTLCIEEVGQQGESLVAREPEIFLKTKVSLFEQRKAKQVWQYLKQSGLNRNQQPIKKIDWKRMSAYQPGRKTITYMGQNDYESGLFPYTENAKCFHSPTFRSSLEALEYLSLVAYRNDWNLFYRPHPIMKMLGHAGTEEEYDEIFDIVGEDNINEVIDNSDLIITILSQSAYIALIREKPVLMLGYTQLKGKGCTYEAFEKDKIEDLIQEGIHQGFTQKQQKNFKRHIAQLLKYYLYDDGIERELRFGRIPTKPQ